MIKRLLVVTVAGLLLSGCGAKNDGPQSGGLNVPGKAGSGAKTAALDPMEKAFRDQYVTQCREQMGQMPPDSGIKKTPDEICTCVGDKVWGISKNASNSGQKVDPVLMQKEMMACMGIDMDAMQREMQQQAAEYDANANDEDAGPPRLPDELMDSSSDEAEPDLN